MTLPLTDEQQQAVDASGEVPVRVTPQGTRTVHVLLRSHDFDWIRGLVDDIADVQRLIDPRSQHTYALVPLSIYERFKAFFEDDPLTPEEKRHLLREFGRRAGWNDPEMEVYNDFRKSS